MCQKARNIFEILVELNKYDNLIMIVGSDKEKEVEMLIKKYNGVEARHGYYKFDTVKVKSETELNVKITKCHISKMGSKKMSIVILIHSNKGHLMTLKAKKYIFDVRKSMGIRNS